MKLIALLLASCSLCAQPAMVPVFVLSNHLGFAAYWTQPTNELWVAEYSTNAIEWHRCLNTTSLSMNGLCFTETGTNWTTRQFYVRLRKL